MPHPTLTKPLDLTEDGGNPAQIGNPKLLQFLGSSAETLKVVEDMLDCSLGDSRFLVLGVGHSYQKPLLQEA